MGIGREGDCDESEAEQCSRIRTGLSELRVQEMPEEAIVGGFVANV